MWILHDGHPVQLMAFLFPEAAPPLTDDSQRLVQYTDAAVASRLRAEVERLTAERDEWQRRMLHLCDFFGNPTPSESEYLSTPATPEQLYTWAVNRAVTIRHRRVVQLTLDPDTIARLDEMASRCVVSRSGMVERLVREADMPIPRTSGAKRESD